LFGPAGTAASSNSTSGFDEWYRADFLGQSPR
jgi:hypothetical protein